MRPRPKPGQWVASAVATVFGAGLVPKAPGTAGSLAAIPILWFTLRWPLSTQALFWAFVALVGTWAAARVCEQKQSRDHQTIVVDELLGMGVATFGLYPNWTTIAVGFFLFRFFDIAKIPPVRAVDRWSKSQASFAWAGFGVLADDVLAGLQTRLGLWLLTHGG